MIRVLNFLPSAPLTLLCLSILLFSPSALAQPADTVADGKTVTIDYILEVDGEVVQSSFTEGMPLTFVQGQDPIIPGLQRQIEGMKIGEEKTVVLQPADGFGMPNPGALVDVPKTNLPEGNPEVGMMLHATNDEGQTLNGLIREIKQDTVLVDFNHPLAGKTLTFNVTIKNVTSG